MPCAVSLRLVMTTVIALVAAGSALVAFFPPYLSGLDAVNSSMDDLRLAYTEHMADEVHSLFTYPVTLAKTMQEMSRGGALPYLNASTQWTWAATYFQLLSGNRDRISQIRALSLTEIYYSGPLTAILDARDYSVTQKVYMMVCNESFYRWLPLLPNGDPDFANELWSLPVFFFVVPPTPAFDLGWESDNLYGFDSVQMTLHVVLRDFAGTRTSFMSIVILPKEVNAFFQSFHLRPRSRAFCFDVNSGTVIGVSWNEALTILTDKYYNYTVQFPDWERMKNLALTNISEPLAASIVQRIGADALRYGPIRPRTDTTKGLSEIQKYNLGSGADLIATNVVEVTGPRLRIRVVLALSVIDFQEDLYKTRERTIGGVFGGIGAMMLLAFVLAHLMVQPFKRLEERMYLTATLQDDVTVDPASMLSEVAGMQRSYEKMRDELTKMKSYLPQSVLVKLYATASDAEREAKEEETEMEESLQLSESLNRSATSNTRSHSQRKGADTMSKSSRASRTTTRSGVPIAPAGLNTAVSVAAKKVTVLMLNLTQFHSAVKAGGITQVGPLQELILSSIESIVANNKGVIDSFQGDHVNISFNAVSFAAAHIQKAAATALAIVRALKAVPSLTAPTIGISSGSAYVGNMGTSSMKRFCIVGTVLPQAVALERLCKLYAAKGAKILVHSGMFAELVEFEYQAIGIFKLPSLPEGRIVASLEQQKDFRMDEWMYQLQGESGKATGHPYEIMNKAFESIQDRSFTAASEHLAHALVSLTAIDDAESKKAPTQKMNLTLLGGDALELMVKNQQTTISLGEYYDGCVC